MNPQWTLCSFTTDQRKSESGWISRLLHKTWTVTSTQHDATLKAFSWRGFSCNPSLNSTVIKAFDSVSQITFSSVWHFLTMKYLFYLSRGCQSLGANSYMNHVLCSGSVVSNRDSSRVPVGWEIFLVPLMSGKVSHPHQLEWRDNDSSAVTHSPSYSLVSALQHFVNVSNYPIRIIIMSL